MVECRADKRRARVPKMACGNFSLAHGIHCCNNFLFISFTKPASVCCEGYAYIYIYIHIHTYIHTYTYIDIYRVSQEECARLREGVPYVKVYRYNPKHLYPKLNGYGDNGQRSLKL